MSEEVKAMQKNTAWNKFIKEYSIILVAAGLIIVATILGGTTFMNGQNFINIFRGNAVLVSLPLVLHLSLSPETSTCLSVRSWLS